MTTEAHPPLAELAERIARSAEDFSPDFPRHGTVEFQEHVTAHIAPLYAELERLKAENVRLQILVNNAKDQFDDIVKICKGDQ